MDRTWLLAMLALAACTSTAPARETVPDAHESVEAAHDPAPVSPGGEESRSCAGIAADAPYDRAVDGSSRACSSDADCVSVMLDCSNLRCTAVNRAFEQRYAAPLDCSQYHGEVGNYDCRPQFGAERPVCIEGCCASERIEARATAEEACGAIAGIYGPDHCTVFGPTFSVDQCLADVRDIRSTADAAGLRRLQIGLDCARAAGTCAQIELCVAEFHGR